MAALARAASLLALLPALARAGAPAAGEAALEQAGGECAAAMRVELLQRPPGAPAASLLGGASNASMATGMTVRLYALTKSTFALSSIHVGKSLAFKRYFLPVITEQELTGIERDDFLRFVKGAVDDGAALPDTGEYSSEKFDLVAWKEDCGKAARVRLKTILGEGFHGRSRTYGSSMPPFMFHGIYAAGHGDVAEHADADAISHREVGGLTVRHVERIFQEELGGVKGHSPWMDINTALYDNDLDGRASQFLAYGVKVTALRWPSAIGHALDSGAQAEHFYSLIVHVPDTQEIFEFISPFKPSDPRLAWEEFPVARHVFTQDELTLLRQAHGLTPLHISRTHYDLDAVKEHYLHFFELEPLHEMRDEDTGVSFVSFWHQKNTPGIPDVIRVQVMYWNTPDQSNTVAHTTEWLERRLEQLNSQYMKSYTSCWPVWGDNHYTVVEATEDYVQSVMEKYEEAGIGYMAFKKNDYVMTTYFPLPGGFYLELQPQNNHLAASEGMQPWVGLPEEGPAGSELVTTDTTDTYCYSFVCPA